MAGLRPGDVIVDVEGKPTSGADHEQVLDQLRSSAAIDLLIRRGKRTFRVHLLASNAPLEPLMTSSLGTESEKIAYLRVAQFTSGVGKAVRAAVQNFQENHAQGYILDLRDNPGGYLDAATQVAGVFVSGQFGAKVRRNGGVEPISSGDTPITEAPLIVLVNEGTASAAGFVAGALQARKRAVLVGRQTYGKECGWSGAIRRLQTWRGRTKSGPLTLPAFSWKLPTIRPDLRFSACSPFNRPSLPAGNRLFQPPFFFPRLESPTA